VPVAPSLTFRAIAVLSGAIAFPCVATGAVVLADSAGSVAVVGPEDPGTTAPSGPTLQDLADFDPADSRSATELGTVPPAIGEPDIVGPAPAMDSGDKLSPGAPADSADPGVPGRASDSSDPESNFGLKNQSANQSPDMGCLSRTICAIKQKIRWQTPAWTFSQCQNIASAVLTSSRHYDISPSLMLAIMINESDLNEKAARVTLRGNKIYAKDGGLMAIRCVLDSHNHCLNGNVRGLSLTQVMSPATNIALGARELAYWKNGGAVAKTVVNLRDTNGHVRPVTKTVRCQHKDHGYWAHYNHGPYYIDHGYARHYPHRVAVIDHALATVMNLDPPELRGGRITIRDAGRRERTVDRPLEPRYKKLCTQIQSVGACSAVAVN
jgi:Transglycosylase SLT domain